MVRKLSFRLTFLRRTGACLTPVAFVLGMSMLAGCGDSGPAQAQRPAPEVEVVVLAEESVTLTRELPGRTVASLVAEVRPQVGGIVRERLFTEGTEVEADEPLYRLGEDTYRADLARAEAALARARATADAARLTADRVESLVDSGAVSRQEHDNARAALLQAEADVKVAEAQVRSAEVTLAYTVIKAPIGGYIGKSSVTRGALVTTNQAQPLATIQQFDPMYVDVTQSSSELLELRRALAAGRLESVPDMRVKVRLEDGSFHEHEGRLAFSEMTVDPSTGSFSLRVIVPNPARVLLPGMYVHAVLPNAVRDKALLLPQQAVQRDPRGNTSVFVVTPANEVEARAVQVSRTVGDDWLVEGGVVAGERVVVSGLQKVGPGAAVSPVPVSPPDSGVPQQPPAPGATNVMDEEQPASSGTEE